MSDVHFPDDAVRLRGEAGSLYDVMSLVDAADAHARSLAEQLSAEPAITDAADGIAAVAGRCRQAVALVCDGLARQDTDASARWTRILEATVELLVAQYTALVGLLADGAAVAGEHHVGSEIGLAAPLTMQVATLTASM